MERFLPGESGPGYKCGMSLRSVTIEGFRCFRHLEVQGLTRVNLVVGRNNSGKTSFLEAVEALVSEASPTVLYRSSIDRGEYKLTRDSDDDEHLAIDVRRWFYGHRLEPGVTLSIRDSGDGNLALTRAIVRSEQLASSINPALSRPELASLLWLSLETKRAIPGRLQALPLRVDGFIGAGTAEEIAGHNARLTPPVVFFSTRRQESTELQAMWERIELSPEENEVIASLKIIEPRLEEIRFQKFGCHVLLAGESEKVPLGSLGEGVNRMLGLSLALTAARSGYLFVDEIESGLHYSTHLSMWKLVVETARRLGVQVFCTTHSKDCLEALAQLHAESPQLAEEVSVHRLEQGATQSVRMAAGTIASTTDGGVEIR